MKKLLGQASGDSIKQCSLLGTRFGLFQELKTLKNKNLQGTRQLGQKELQFYAIFGCLRVLLGLLIFLKGDRVLPKKSNLAQNWANRATFSKS